MILGKIFFIFINMKMFEILGMFPFLQNYNIFKVIKKINYIICTLHNITHGTVAMYVCFSVSFGHCMFLVARICI